MAQVYVLRVYASNAAGNPCVDRLLVTRNFKEKDQERAADMYERTVLVYEQKCNRGDDPSYRLTLELRTGKGRKSALVDAVKEGRIFPAHRSHA